MKETKLIVSLKREKKKIEKLGFVELSLKNYREQRYVIQRQTSCGNLCVTLFPKELANINTV